MKYIIKKLSGLLLFLIINFAVQGQITNGDFQTFSASCTPSTFAAGTNSTAPFQQGCVDNWEVSHGTPQIVDIAGEKIALIWAGDFPETCDEYTIQDGGEGIMLQCSFIRAKTYTFSIDFAVGNNPPSSSSTQIDRVNVYLANDMISRIDINYCPGQTNLYEIPNVIDKQLIYQELNFSSPTLITKTFTFTPNQNYEWLWIYPSESGYHKILYVDNVRQECELNQTYSMTSNLPTTTRRSDYIQTVNNVDVLNSQNVNFFAGKKVLLNPGFEVTPGGNFVACIRPCTILNCNNEIKKGNGKVEGLENRESDNDNGKRIESRIYPNPSKGIFTIELKNIENNLFKVEISNMMGEIIYSNNTDKVNTKIDITDQPKGLYLMKITGDDETTLIHKLMHN